MLKKEMRRTSLYRMDMGLDIGRDQVYTTGERGECDLVLEGHWSGTSEVSLHPVS